MSVSEIFVRLKPPVNQDQAAAFLTQSAKIAWGDAVAEELTPLLVGIAQSMEIVSALEIPEEIEPLFGENHARAGEVFR